jgi:hypothetical protein
LPSHAIDSPTPGLAARSLLSFIVSTEPMKHAAYPIRGVAALGGSLAAAAQPRKMATPIAS